MEQLKNLDFFGLYQGLLGVEQGGCGGSPSLGEGKGEL